MKALAGIATVAFFLACPEAARADLHVEVMPLLVGDTPTGGWAELAARIENPDGVPRRGIATLRSRFGPKDDDVQVSSAPFAVAPGRTAMLVLPTHGPEQGGIEVTVRLDDDKGQKLAAAEARIQDRTDPSLFDVHHPSKLVPALRSARVPISYEPRGRGYGKTQPLGVSEPLVDPTSGDAILPQRSAGYYGVDVVTMSSDTLARSLGAELDALLGYVSAGGTLAVILARPEDLRSPNLTALTGGPVRVGAPSRGSMGPLPAPPAATEKPEAPEEDADPDPDVPDPFSPAPGSGHAPGGSSGKGAPVPAPGAPSPAVLSKLIGFEGGTLVPSPYGAMTRYGLGEVQLLGFDPTRAPALDDPWVHARMLDLVGRAWDRASARVFPHGGPASTGVLADGVERVLDPQDSARWAVIIAALLLLGYAVVVGPLNFRSAEKQRAPLRAFARIPILAAAAAVAVLFTGMTARGWRGRASHLTLVETRAGGAHGTARRWRGFYLPKGRALSVRTTEPNSVLDPVGERRDPDANLVIGRDGATLSGITPRPWQALVVREDGFADLGGGIVVLRQADGTVALTNHTRRALVGIVVSMPGDVPRYFARLREGDSVLTRSGAPLPALGYKTVAGSSPVHTFEPHLVERILDKETAGLSEAWGAIVRVAGPVLDWFPSDQPVVLAQLEGGEGTTQDAGLPLTRDRTLVRVLGYGGTP